MPGGRDRLHLGRRPPAANRRGRRRSSIELHVRGFTMRHPEVARAQRGTFAGLASPAVIDHLRRARRHRGRAAAGPRLRRRPASGRARPRQLLGLQLDRLLSRPTALSRRPAAIAEFKTMVKRLHAAGIEVHPRRRLQPHRRGQPARADALLPRHRQCLLLPARRTTGASTHDFTGCGNSLNLDHPAGAADGHGLAALLGQRDARRRLPLRSRPDAGRESGDYTQRAPFFDAVRQDPVLSRGQADRRAVGHRPGGYQLGNFPPRLGRVERRATATRCAASGRATTASSPSLPRGSPARRTSSASRPAAVGQHQFRHRHDGFTLQDLVSYNSKHNEANGEDNRDGTDNNLQLELRRRGADRRPGSSPCATGRSATCWRRCCCRRACRCCSPATSSAARSAATTTPIARTTRFPGSTGTASGPRTRSSAPSCHYLVHLRRPSRLLAAALLPRRGRIGRRPQGHHLAHARGAEPTPTDWDDPLRAVLGYVLGGAAGEFYTPGGQRDIDESFLVMLNA